MISFFFPTLFKNNAVDFELPAQEEKNRTYTQQSNCTFAPAPDETSDNECPAEGHISKFRSE